MISTQLNTNGNSLKISGVISLQIPLHSDTLSALITLFALAFTRLFNSVSKRQTSRFFLSWPCLQAVSWAVIWGSLTLFPISQGPLSFIAWCPVSWDLLFPIFCLDFCFRQEAKFGPHRICLDWKWKPYCLAILVILSTTKPGLLKSLMILNLHISPFISVGFVSCILKFC